MATRLENGIRDTRAAQTQCVLVGATYRIQREHRAQRVLLALTAQRRRRLTTNKSSVVACTPADSERGLRRVRRVYERDATCDDAEAEATRAAEWGRMVIRIVDKESQTHFVNSKFLVLGQLKLMFHYIFLIVDSF